jgi:predicted NAD-dependent protein-ADP-ribosyltransferase YbiA (DUF1768 family)
MTTPTTLTDLRSRATRGEPFDYLHFWGHQVRTDGVLTSSCFSQWYPARFEIDGVVYPRNIS